jgi:predicted nucleic acid-binding protein
MTTFLCDTNILSELARPQPNSGVEAWAQGLSSIAVSVITVEEIAYGLAWKPNLRILEWFQDFLDRYSEVLPVTADIAARAGRLRGTLQAQGRTRTQADMLIAATAQAHGLTLVTRNVRDFEDCGLALLDPFL